MNLLSGWRRRSGSSEATENTSAGSAAEDDDWGVDVEVKLKLPTSRTRSSNGGTAGASLKNGRLGYPLPATAVRPQPQQHSRTRTELEQRRAQEESRRRAEEESRRRAEEDRRRAEEERRRAEEELKRIAERRHEEMRQREEAAQRELEEHRRKAQASAERAIAQESEDFFTVQLPMYDLSNGLAKFVPAALLSGYKFEGVWHTGVRVFGKEIWFGGCVLESDFDESPFGIPQRVIRLGKTCRTYEELMEFIHDELAKAYNTKTYDILGRNCNHFSNELVKFLLQGSQIPDEVLMQPQWAQSGALVQALRPALNAWLGGFGGQGSAVMSQTGIRHMTRAEKEREQRRLEIQWREWVDERRKERAIQEEEQRREAADEEFQDFMLEQHQRMQEENQEEERKEREEEARRAEQRLQEAEQTLRDILASAEVVDAAVIEWAVTEAKAAGVEAKAPYLLRDAEYAIRKKSEP